MIIKQSVIGLLLASVLFACNQKQPPATPEGKVLIELKTVQLPAGWGYEVYVDKKLYIKQNYIPAVPGGKTFTNKEDAEKTGKLVVSKMEHGEKPTVTIDELKQLKVVQ